MTKQDFKVLDENKAGCFYVLRVRKGFLNTTPEAKTINKNYQ